MGVDRLNGESKSDIIGANRCLDSLSCLAKPSLRWRSLSERDPLRVGGACALRLRGTVDVGVASLKEIRSVGVSLPEAQRVVGVSLP